MHIQFFRRVTQSVFNTAICYKWLRTVGLGGLPTPALIELIQANDSDIVLDVGCGTGFLCTQILFKKYIGIDVNGNFMDTSNLKYREHISFIHSNVTTYDFKPHTATKAILYGLLHHLSDKNCIDLLNRLAECVTGAIITLDPVYSRFHLVNNVLCKLDRGQYVRTPEQYLKLAKAAHVSVDVQKISYSNSWVAKYNLFRLFPKLR